MDGLGYLWSVQEEQVYHGKKLDVCIDELKQVIVLEWYALPQRFIDHSNSA